MLSSTSCRCEMDHVARSELQRLRFADHHVKELHASATISARSFMGIRDADPFRGGN